MERVVTDVSGGGGGGGVLRRSTNARSTLTWVPAEHRENSVHIKKMLSLSLLHVEVFLSSLMTHQLLGFGIVRFSLLKSFTY